MAGEPPHVRMERELIAMQEQHAITRVNDPEGAARQREEYKALHALWCLIKPEVKL